MALKPRHPESALSGDVAVHRSQDAVRYQPERRVRRSDGDRSAGSAPARSVSLIMAASRRLVAAEFPFRRVLGIDFLASFMTSRSNIARCRPRELSAGLRLRMRSREASCGRQPRLLFLKPLRESVMERVAERLVARQNGNRIIFIMSTEPSRSLRENGDLSGYGDEKGTLVLGYGATSSLSPVEGLPA